MPCQRGSVASVSMTSGGQTTTANYIGAAPFAIAGVMQLNALAPTGLSAGNVPEVVQVGGVSRQPGVTIAVSGN